MFCPFTRRKCPFVLLMPGRKCVRCPYDDRTVDEVAQIRIATDDLSDKVDEKVRELVDLIDDISEKFSKAVGVRKEEALVTSLASLYYTLTGEIIERYGYDTAKDSLNLFLFVQSLPVNLVAEVMKHISDEVKEKYGLD